MPIGLENYIVEYLDGLKHAPEEAVQIVLEETAQGVPTGFALKDGKWYVIQTSGQGPYVLWEERKGLNPRTFHEACREVGKQWKIFTRTFKEESLKRLRRIKTLVWKKK